MEDELEKLVNELIKPMLNEDCTPRTFLKAIQDFKCAYCGKAFLDSLDAFYSCEVDHIKPKALRLPNDDLWDVVGACRLCNHLKGSFDPPGTTREERILAAKNHINEKKKTYEDRFEKVKVIAAKYRSSLGG